MVGTASLLSIEEPLSATTAEEILPSGQSFIPFGQADRPVGNRADGLALPLRSRTAVAGALVLGSLVFPLALVADLGRATARILRRRPATPGTDSFQISRPSLR